MATRVFGSLLSALIALFSTMATAQLEVVNDLEAEFLSRVSAEDRSGAEELLAFKHQVQREAPVRTLKLCEGYRRAWNMGPVPTYKKFVYSSNEVQAEWARVFAHGAKYAVVAGQKGVALDLLQTPSSTMAYWYDSLETVELINSMGFLAASMHCFDSMDQRQIRHFAATILSADRAGSQSVYTVSLLGVVEGALVPLLRRLVPTVWNSATYLADLVRPYLTRALFNWTASITAPILVDNYVEYMGRLQRVRDGVVPLLANLDPKKFDEDQSRLARFSKLLPSFELFLAARQEQLDKSKTTVAQDAFENFLRANLDAQARSIYREDLRYLKNKRPLTEYEAAYFPLLNRMLYYAEQLR